MSMSLPRPTHGGRLVDRRSVLLGGAAGIAGVRPLRAQSSHGDMPALQNQLIAMDDLDVRKAVGSTFIQYLKCAAPVKATFFPDATPPEVTIDPNFKCDYPAVSNAGDPPWSNSPRIMPPENGITPMLSVPAFAEALVVWALANTATYSFNSTVNGQSAKNLVTAFCDLNSGPVKCVSENLYTSLFPQHAKSGETTFAYFLASDMRSYFWKFLATTLLSDAFFVKAMARKEADPGNFPQYVYMQFFKLRTLMGASWGDDRFYKAALDRYAPFIQGQPWTIYQYLTVDKFSEQTFLPEVQKAVGAATVVGQHNGESFCSGGKVPQCHTSHIEDYNHGLAVEAWLKGAHVAPPNLFTGTAPDNKQ